MLTLRSLGEVGRETASPEMPALSEVEGEARRFITRPANISQHRASSPLTCTKANPYGSKYMKIITLGTSHGDPTVTRFNSSTLFRTGTADYLIDAGSPVNALMIRRNIPLSALRAVFITHQHEDHTT